MTWQASMQIYYNNNNSKEQNKTKQKKSLRKELYRVVFLILTVQHLYHDLRTVNNTKKARKENKSS